MPRVSVIVPVFNTADYLHRCLQSICSQTLKDIEIICVNDCSTDNSLDILTYYANSDSRIKIINFNSNMGSAVARNEAIKIANGEFIGFVDSDDYIDQDFYEKLYTTSLNYKANIVVADAKIVQNNKMSSAVKFSTKVNVNKLYFTGYFPLAIYETRIIHSHFNIVHFFENIRYGEDRFFPVGACYYADTVIGVDDTFYYYCRRERSQSYNMFFKDILNDYLISSKIILNSFNKLDYSARDYFIFFNIYVNDILEACYYSPIELKYILQDAFYYFIDNSKFKDHNLFLIYDKFYSILKDNDYIEFQKHYSAYRKRELFFILRSKIKFNNIVKAR